ncbi:MAG: hypothetical protein S4CHLAM102_10320 [Chlamydiia bacterium]|nr:hypothetical protein [Chlamydiia bacterium]
MSILGFAGGAGGAQDIIAFVQSVAGKVPNKMNSDTMVHYVEHAKEVLGRVESDRGSQPQFARELTDGAYRLVDRLWKNFKSNHELKGNSFLRQELEDLSAAAICQRLGGQISKETYGSFEEFRSFIKVNLFHHQAFALGTVFMEKDGEPCVPIAVEVPGSAIPRTRDVKWSELDCEVCADGGLKVLHDGALVFETDRDGMLTDDYSLSQWGIRAYGSDKREVMRPQFRQPDLAGRCYIEPTVYLGRGSGPSQLQRTHAAFRLVDETGATYLVGKYGMWGGEGIRSPDPVLLSPKDRYEVLETRLELTSEEFAAVLDKVNKDRCDPNIDSNAMTANCTSYLVELLDTCCPGKLGEGNLRQKCQAASLECLALFFFNSKTIRSFAKVWDQLTFHNKYVSWGLFIATVLPYAIHLIFTLTVYAATAILSIVDKKCALPDLHIWDIIFRPWKVTYDSPYQLASVICEHNDEEYVS